MTKLVYSLVNYFEKYPERMNGPLIRKIHGGMGSFQWWYAVETGKIKSFERTGVIREKIRHGMEPDDAPYNACVVESEQGEIWELGFEVDKPEYYKLFQVGTHVRAKKIRVELNTFRIPFLLHDYIDRTSEIWILD